MQLNDVGMNENVDIHIIHVTDFFSTDLGNDYCLQTMIRLDRLAINITDLVCDKIWSYVVAQTRAKTQTPVKQKRSQYRVPLEPVMRLKIVHCVTLSSVHCVAQITCILRCILSVCI